LLIVGGINNPAIALTSSPFQANIGNNTSASGPSAQVTFTVAPLTTLSVAFPNGIVNTTTPLELSLLLRDAIPAGGAITVRFPATLVWQNDIATNHLIPINRTLPCYGLTSNINNSTIHCAGLFSTQVVTISNAFTSIIPSGTNVRIVLGDLFAPPTTQSVDSLFVTTRDSSLHPINELSALVTGMVANSLLSYSMVSSLTGAFGVNNFVGGLRFSFVLPDTIRSSDYFQVLFPAGTSISYTTTTMSISFQSANYNAANLTLTIHQTASNPLFFEGKQIGLTFIRYRAPPSTQPT